MMEHGEGIGVVERLDCSCIYLNSPVGYSACFAEVTSPSAEGTSSPLEYKREWVMGRGYWCCRKTGLYLTCIYQISQVGCSAWSSTNVYSGSTNVGVSWNRDRGIERREMEMHLYLPICTVMYNVKNPHVLFWFTGLVHIKWQNYFWKGLRKIWAINMINLVAIFNECC